MYTKRNNELRIIALYTGNYYQQLYLREIAKVSGLPLKTTQNVLALLESRHILRSITKGKHKYFFLNLENPETKLSLLQAEIEKTIVFLETYPYFKVFLKALRTPIPILLFGSFARFSAQKNSDIDILVVADKENELPIHLLPHKIHQITLREQTFMKTGKKAETLIKEIEERHIILNNHSFFIQAWWEGYGTKIEMVLSS